MSALTREDYIEIGKRFASPALFDAYWQADSPEAENAVFTMWERKGRAIAAQLAAFRRFVRAADAVDGVVDPWGEDFERLVDAKTEARAAIDPAWLEGDE